LASDLPAGNEGYLDAVVALARRSDVGLIFVKTPDRRALGCRDAVLEHFAERNNIPFYDYNVMPFSRTLSRLHFADMQHANEFGAVPFNLNLAGLLAQELGRHVDEQAQARYEAIEMASLQEVAQGKQVTYTLAPANAGGDLRYSWVAELNGTEVARSADDSPSSSFTLDASATGNYRIRVQVRDASHPETVLAGRLTLRVKKD